MVIQSEYYMEKVIKLKFLMNNTKIHKAHLQGKGVNITFDPFQQANHQHLRGNGIMSAAKRYAQPLLDRGVRYANEISDRVKRVTCGRIRKSRKHGSGFLDVIKCVYVDLLDFFI